MTLLIDKNINYDFSDDIENIFNLLSFNIKNLKISGTSKYKNLLYYSDFDLFESVEYNKNIPNKIKKIIRNLLKVNDLYITDIKFGKIEEYEVIDNLNNINIEKLKNLVDENLISKNQESKYKNLIDKLNFKNLVKLKENLKFHSVRIKPNELLQLTNKEIEKLIFTGGLVKLDFIYFIEGWKFSEFSIIYDFLKNGETLNKNNLDFITSIKYDINKYYNEKNYFKMAKRIFSLKIYKNENVEDLIKLFNSPIGLLSNIKSLISTLILLIETYKNTDYKKIEIEISNFKNRLSNITLKDFIKNQKVINNVIDKLINLPNKYNKKYLHYLLKLEKFFNNIVNTETKKYLKKINILPLKKQFKFSI